MGSRKTVRFGPFELDRSEGRLLREGEAVALRPKSFAVLDYLLENRGRLVRKEELLDAVWPDTSVTDTVLKVCIREIREALGDERESPRFIETAHRLGYRFLAGSPRPSLPSALTSFIGREPELSEIRRLLGETRLLTLTGPGGSGKTRLAVEAASSYEGEDAVSWVDLASVGEPGSVAGAIATALELREQPGQSVEDLLLRSLETREMLLVLDNCEHLVESVAGLVHRLLRGTSKLRVLATSREALRVDGEAALEVLPLSAEESVRLFATRASAVRGDFALTPESSPQVSELCRRLDGLPLAIELAAARLKSVPLPEMLSRIDDRFRLLGEGARGDVPRHRTLRAAIDWSFDLLAENERRLLPRLALFSGGFTLASAERVGGDDVLEPLSHLVEKSLVQLDGSGRYRLLETVRQYAREKLELAGERAAVERRHVDCFLDLARRVEPRLNGPERKVALDELSAETGNVSTALALSLERDDGARALSIAAALFWFWFHSGRWSEGRSWLERALARPRASEATKERAGCLFAAGVLDWTSGKETEARSLLEESAALFRALGDEHGEAYALEFHALTLLGMGDTMGARRESDESVGLFRRAGEDRFGLATALASRGIVAIADDAHGEARPYLEESIAIARESRDEWALALPLRNLGIVAFREGRLDEARRLLRESLEVQSRLRERWFLSRSLETLAAVLAVDGEHEKAARLFGAGEALREKLGASVLRVYRPDYDRGVSVLEHALGPERLGALWSEGRSLSLEEALALGLD